MWMLVNKEKSFNCTENEIVLDTKKNKSVLIQNFSNNKEINKINNNQITKKNNKQNLLNLPINNELTDCQSVNGLKSPKIPQLPSFNIENSFEKDFNEYSVVNNNFDNLFHKKNVLHANLYQKNSLNDGLLTVKSESLITNKQQRLSLIKFVFFFHFNKKNFIFYRPNKVFKPSLGLLCNFEESVLKGRLHPLHTVGGFQLQIGKKNSFL